MIERLLRLASAPRAPLYFAIVGLVMCLPALDFGLQADDWLFPWKLEQGAPIWSLFEIEASAVPSAREQGFLVWWSDPQLVGKFFRPLASLSHALDFTLWPGAAWFMRLENALIYAAAVGLAAQLYRRLCARPAVAALASLLFVVDDGHAFSAGWISGRNTLLALLFALLALELHIRARASARTALYVASSASVACALLSAEAGVWALSLLLAYALCVETSELKVRLASVAAPLCVGLAWAGVYVAMSCGFRGSSFYRDPGQPLTALVEGTLDLPVWFNDLFGLGGAPIALMYPTQLVRLGTLPIALSLLWLMWPALRRSRENRFFAVAALLCLAPVVCTLPTARVLLGPSFGAMGWIASSIAQGWSAADLRGRVGARLLLGLHLVLASLLFVPALGATQSFANGTRALVSAVEPARDVIVVQAPVELLSNYAMLELTRINAKARMPRSLQLLYCGVASLTVERVDARTLDIEVDGGWGRVPIERIFGAPDRAPRTGSEVRLSAFTARVLTSAETGMPRRVRFTFPSSLEAPERQWLSWQSQTPAAFRLPAVGQRVRLAPLSFFSALRPGR
ncbi:MAG TPA: hypothetical protein VFZ61_06140 [Polyangiales bacterium]